MTERVWVTRWRELREAGLSYQQARKVYELLDGISAFRTRHPSLSAWTSLVEVYEEER